jgi:hypothetical protein
MLGIIPCPHEPKDFDSFLNPLIAEVLRSQTSPSKVPRTNEPWKSIIVLVSADTKAFEKTLKMKGVNSYYACRFCMQKGCLKPNKHIYYPNSPRDEPKRIHDDFIAKAMEIEC